MPAIVRRLDAAGDGVHLRRQAGRRSSAHTSLCTVPATKAIDPLVLGAAGIGGPDDAVGLAW